MPSTLNSGHKLRTVDLFSSPHLNRSSLIPPSTVPLTTKPTQQPLSLATTQPLTTQNLTRPAPNITTIFRRRSHKAKNETPHSQLPHLRPQSLQTRSSSIPLAPPRRRTRTRRPRFESRVFGQCAAEIGLEGHQEFE